MSPLPKKPARAQDTLDYHPFASKFPLITGDEFKKFVADVASEGFREPTITLYQGKILDGRNRYRAHLRTKVEIRFEEFKGDDAAAAAFVISKNIHRRHLSRKQHGEFLIKLVAAAPGKSDRKIAKEAGVEHKQVSRARQKGEATGAIAPVEKRTGADGRTRKTGDYTRFHNTRRKTPKTPTMDQFVDRVISALRKIPSPGMQAKLAEVIKIKARKELIDQQADELSQEIIALILRIYAIDLTHGRVTISKPFEGPPLLDVTPNTPTFPARLAAKGDAVP
jgi:ParB-like chromosome segregation protein Spo0J